ncbi:MAG: PAS domain-containing protein [Planctomycetales bacterium]|nr:PAS domain-containing protein [Planctomycetales bacterium]
MPKQKSGGASNAAVVINSGKPGFPIVGIGASAGGLEALDELLGHMPTNTGMAFVVVTHQHPGHTSLLPELLGKETEMLVVEATDGLKLKPNHVYVGPPGGNLAILNGALHRMNAEKNKFPPLPIDYFFRSLADDQQERAICIVLSGTGTDGTIGLTAIKRESGMAMAQEPSSAKYAGMPSSAIATGLVDYVSTPAEMPAKLVAYVKGPYLAGGAVAAELPSVPAEPMQKIFVLLRSRTGHDFSSYKSNTLRRRIQRRMNVHQIRKPDQYVRFLQENPHEIDILFKELLISVTNFFRDADAWESLVKSLQELIKSRPANHAFRAWVPGCATGEEAFSAAIALRECIEKVGRRIDVQVFGTDLDAEAIEVARIGQYPAGIEVDVSSKRLERYFVHDDGTYRIHKEVREMVIFAPQNVIKDPPFTKLDLISCRNLLIYLNADLQKKLLPIFHYALKPGGLLFLGPSETIGPFTDLFDTIDKRWKIFRRKESVTPIYVLPEIPAQPLTGDEGNTAASTGMPAVKETHLTIQIERLLLSRFTPATIVVNDQGDIIYIHGRTGMYLEPTQGQPRANILLMAREGLQIELASAMRQCVATGVDVVRENVRVRTNGDFTNISLTVAKLSHPESVRGLLMVTLQPTTTSAPEPDRKTKRKPTNAAEYERVDQLERELQYLKESHQTTHEELETSNEELKSTNEELQSTNEELQSTNEELETSKEEMQSLNEELTTVNAELQSKIDELTQANDDMQNLLNSTDIATVFLDNDLNIKRFTDQAKTLISLRQSDVGRPIVELTSNLKADNLAGDCRAVLQTLVFKENEVRTNDGGSYLMRIMPYRTGGNVIDGLVLTFVNIKQLRQRKSKDLISLPNFENVVETVREPLVILDESLHVVLANRSFYRVFHTTPRQTEGKLVYELGTGQWDVPKLRELLESILPKNSKFEDFEIEADLPRLGKRVFVLNARRFEQPEGVADMILLALEDMTNRKPAAGESND